MQDTWYFEVLLNPPMITTPLTSEPAGNFRKRIWASGQSDLEMFMDRPVPISGQKNSQAISNVVSPLLS